jgi:hypothetical protein
MDVLHRAVLRVSRRKAAGRLRSLIGRGKRLTVRLQQYEHGRGRDTALDDRQNWTSACIKALTGIYPTSQPTDVFIRALNKGGTSFSGSAQAGLDVLENLTETLEDYDQPPAQARFVDWLREQKGIVAFLNKTGYVLAWVLGMVMGVYKEELVSLVRQQPLHVGIVQLRVIVLDTHDIPVNDAHVWSSIGGEPTIVRGGWQFDIPRELLTMSDLVTVYASKPSAFLAGKTDVILTGKSRETATIRLRADTPTWVRGQVVDQLNKALSGVRVNVVGYDEEAVVTTAGGGFVLSAHAADGQQVQLRAEKDGYKSSTIYHMAGSEAATLMLERE